MTPQQLVRRREEIREEMRALDDELVTIEGALAMHGAARPGRARLKAAYDDETALRAHRLYRAGMRAPWVVDANKQYERDRRREWRRRRGISKQESG